eukprot:COSAG02_NODE_201_length_29473_cov_135.510213_11_plen_79_part_00
MLKRTRLGVGDARYDTGQKAFDSVVVVLVRLVFARGTLLALLELGDFLSAHPQALTIELLSELGKLDRKSQASSKLHL